MKIDGYSGQFLIIFKKIDDIFNSVNQIKVKVEKIFSGVQK